jgi:hypothetical protein
MNTYKTPTVVRLTIYEKLLYSLVIILRIVWNVFFKLDTQKNCLHTDDDDDDAQCKSFNKIVWNVLLLYISGYTEN